MISVVADPSEHEVVREFFELFKTPWEFYRENGHYDVLLCVGSSQFTSKAKLTLVYAGQKTNFDDEQGICIGGERKGACLLSYGQNRLPVYRESIFFQEDATRFLVDARTGECIAFVRKSGDQAFARIGYDLFAEVRALLSEGQPLVNASIPTLELHIALLRNLITGCGIELVEIPPVPDGFRFIACLSHDVDHPSIRLHLCDHTMFGFLYRAIFGSIRKVFRRQMHLHDLLTNWLAVMKLPFVYLGLMNDFWSDFVERYFEIERGLRSTFFVIPFKNQPGKTADGTAPDYRAAGYAAQDIVDIIQKLKSAGCEVGLHGIDAWVDSSRGREELEEIRRLTGDSEIGVRMHWLYLDKNSPAVLENAGATYDSTWGYNQTVGYRAGTTQVFKPLEAKRLLELPMHIMDTALFYTTRMELSPKEAKVILSHLIENVDEFGGTLTINWHDRSVVPERLWRTCYEEVLTDLRTRGAWFSTTGETVSWFRKRRAASFETDPKKSHAARVKVPTPCSDNLPGLRLRVHKVRELPSTGLRCSANYVDVAADKSANKKKFLKGRI